MGYKSDILNYQGIRPDLRRLLSRAGEDLSVVQGTVHYVDAADGVNGNDGLSWDRPLLTMAQAFSNVSSGDTIVFRGKILEQIATPVQVHDVTVIGAANRTRHADTQPVDPDGRTHGASWQPVAVEVATTPCVEVRQQGWRFINILFDAPSDDAAVRLLSNAASGNSERDASHASFLGCKFANGTMGIESDGGQAHVLVDDCEFNNLTDGIKCANTSVRVNQYWTIRNSIFMNNTNHIRSSLTYSEIKGNTFGKFTTISIDPAFNSSQGTDNVIWGNYLSGTYSDAAYVPGTDNEWGGNFNSLTGGVTADDPA